MISFVDIRVEDSYQLKNGNPFIGFGVECGLNDYPIQFQYKSTESISSFVVVSVDTNGTEIERFTLSNSLIQSNGNYHICNGLISYSTNLTGGYYYYIVNDYYVSDYFQVINTTIEQPDIGIDNIISISGLEFYDSLLDVAEHEKNGAPYIAFGREFITSLKLNNFQYKSTQSVTSFQAIRVDQFYNTLETLTLGTALIVSDGTYHRSTGLEFFADILKKGFYYFVVNGRYKSKIFEIFELLCPIISNINITNAIEGETATLSFNGILSGSIKATSITLTYSFSTLDNDTEIVTMYPTSRTFNKSIVIPTGISGACLLTVTNNICDKSYNYFFNITPKSANYLELYSGGYLQLYGGGFLELYS